MRELILATLFVVIGLPLGLIVGRVLRGMMR